MLLCTPPQPRPLAGEKNLSLPCVVSRRSWGCRHDWSIYLEHLELHHLKTSLDEEKPSRGELSGLTVTYFNTYHRPCMKRDEHVVVHPRQL